MRAAFTIPGIDMKFRGQRLDRAHHPAKKRKNEKKKKERGREESIADRKEAERREVETTEAGTSFRIYRRSRSNRTARGYRQAAAECRLQPALRM